MKVVHCMEDVMVTDRKNVIHSLRIMASSSLFGVVFAGAFFGWIESTIDFRMIGAAVGAVLPVVLNMVNFS